MAHPEAPGIGDAFSEFYRGRNPERVYPVEFVVRAFLGNYPRLKAERSSYAGKRALDLGFGDGRNMPLLCNLGMEVHGVEISEEICALARSRMANLGVPVTIEVGRNRSIPYPATFFDVVLACHACYYVDPGSEFEDNMREVGRVLKPGGSFVFSAPMRDSYLVAGAADIGGGHMRVAADPYGLRAGAILKKFDSEDEIRSGLGSAFEDFAIGSCRNDFWGIEEHVWIVSCRKVR